MVVFFWKPYNEIDVLFLLALFQMASRKISIHNLACQVSTEMFIYAKFNLPSRGYRKHICVI